MWTLTLGRISSSSVHCVWRSVWIAIGLTATIWATIPDYPWGTPLWSAVFYGTAGWIHEMATIWAITGGMVFGSILWQVLMAWRNVGIILGAWLERIERDL